jgi:hypothetical protein
MFSPLYSAEEELWLIFEANPFPHETVPHTATVGFTRQQKAMSTTRKGQWKRQNTITLNIYESQNNINHLLSELEQNHTQNANREMAYVQANITDLMGKFQDSQQDLRGDLMDVLESFQKGTMSADELAALLQGEKERGSLSIKLVEEIQSNLEDVIQFVAHFVHDVEQGKPLPKQSFKSLFQELDIVSDSVNTISKVVRTPSRKVREMRAKIGSEVEVRAEKSRGIGGTPAIVSFVQQKKGEDPRPTPMRRDDGSVRSSEQNVDKSNSNKIQMPVLTDRANTPNRIRRGISFRSLTRSPSREMTGDGSEDESGLGLQGRKSNLASKSGGVSRQKSTRITPKASVRSTREDSDDDLSYDSSQELAIKEITLSKKTMRCHRQTQTDDLVPDFTPIQNTAPPATPSKKENNRPRLSSYGTASSPQKDQAQLPHRLEKHGSTYFTPHGITSTPTPVTRPSVILSDVQMNAPLAMSHDDLLLSSKKLVSEAIEEINFGSTMDYETANHSAKQLEEEVKTSGTPNAIEKYLLLKDRRLTQLEMSLKKKESNIAVVVEQQLKVKVEEIRMEASERLRPEGAGSGSVSGEKEPSRGKAASSSSTEKGEKSKASTGSSSRTEKGSESQKKPAPPLSTTSKSVTKQVLKVPSLREETVSPTPSLAPLPLAPPVSVSAPPPQIIEPIRAKESPAVPSSGQEHVPTPAPATATSATQLTKRNSEPKAVVTREKEDWKKIVQTILSFLPKDALAVKSPPPENVHPHHRVPPHPQSKRPTTIQMKEYDGVPLEIQFPSSSQQQTGDLAIGNGKDRRTSSTGEGKPHLQHTSLTQGLRHEEPSPEQFSSLKMIGTTVLPGGDSAASQDTANATRSRPYGSEGSRNGSRGWGMTDDDSGFAFDRTDRAISAEERTRAMASEINEIWVPPPSSLVKKRLPSTIVIFPLNTLDRGTSTDDLLPPSHAPLHLTVDPTPLPADTGALSAPKSSISLDRIRNELSTSTTPLTLLYQNFFPYLSVLSRHHLMAAAAGELSDMSKEVDATAPPKKASAIYSTHAFAALFEMVHEEMSKLEYTSYHALETVPYCEQLIGDLIVLSQAKQPVDTEFLASLREVTRSAPLRFCSHHFTAG